MRTGSDALKPEADKSLKFGASVADFRVLARPLRRISSSSGNARRTSGMKRHQSPPGDQQIRHGKERAQLRGVLEQTAVPNLLESEPVLDNVKRALDLRTNAGLQLLELFGDAALSVVRQRAALARAQCHVPPSGDVLLPVALLHASIACVTEGDLLLAVQQFVRLGHIGRIRRRRHQRMRQPRVGVHADVRLHPEVPLVALLRLMHLRIALAVSVLRRRRCGDDAGVDHGSFAQQQALGGQVLVDRLEDALGPLVLLEQSAELQQRRRIGRVLAAQVDADESADRLAVVHRVFDAFIGETEALLRDVHAKHPLQTDRRAATAFALRIERLDRRRQRRPRHNRFDLGKKAVAPRLALLGSVLELREAHLHGRTPFNCRCLNSLRRLRQQEGGAANKSARSLDRSTEGQCLQLARHVLACAARIEVGKK